eukprot:1887710-Prymnesium_polylepis.1
MEGWRVEGGRWMGREGREGRVWSGDDWRAQGAGRRAQGAHTMDADPPRPPPCATPDPAKGDE